MSMLHFTFTRRAWLHGLLATAQIVAAVGTAVLSAPQPAAASLVQAPPARVLADATPGGTVATQITGTVFRDFNSNGVLTANGIITGTGVSGVTINAYAIDSVTAAATATSNAAGTYTLAGLTPGVDYRVEFSTLPSGYFPTLHGTSNATVPSNGTTVQFATAGTSNVSLGVNKPAEYCQDNPDLCISQMLNGDANTTAPNTVLTKSPYNSTGETPPQTLLGTKSQVGSVWGLAYGRQSTTLYGAAFLKRHVGLGPNGLGAIYQVPNANTATPGAPTLFVDLAAQGIDVGQALVPDNATRGLPSDPKLPSYDTAVYGLIGKVGLGDIDLSEDGTTLWTVNLNSRTLVKIPVATPTSPNITSTPIPNLGCGAGTARPFGLKVYEGQVYVGVVCDAQFTGGTAADLSATVYRFDPTSSSFINVLAFPLNYPKGITIRFSSCDTKGAWQPWLDTTPTPCAPGVVVWPQPILSDIEFDVDGSMILGFMDRMGSQGGSQNYSPIPMDMQLYVTISGGDMLRAHNNNGTFQLESNGTAGSLTGGVGNNQGPDGGEFYAGDVFNRTVPENEPLFHQEVLQGGLALLPGSGEVASNAYDPIDKGLVDVGGVRFLSNIDGTDKRGYLVYNDYIQRPPYFGKSNGLGDLELMCDSAPIEIGNRVWMDANRNGIQDPGEANFPGVEVVLTAPNGNTYTATTNNTGQYFFNNSNVAGGLLITQTYTVSINTTQPALTNYRLTAANIVTPSTTLPDGIDSDGILAGALAQTTVTPAGPGQNNHTLDFGFYLSLFSLGNRVWFDTNNDGLDNDGTAGALGAGAAGITVQLFDVTNTAIQTATTDANGYYRFDNLTAGNYTVVLPASNFATSGRLHDYQNSSPTFNDATDANDNGSLNGVLGSGGDVRSAVITLAEGAIPIGETGIGGGAAGLLGDAFDNLTIDFGFYKLTLGDRVWFDDNFNGLDDFEPGAAGIPVTLTNGSGVVISTTTTDANGLYTFTNLISDTYIVQIQAPGNYVSSLPDGTTSNTNGDDNGQGNVGGTISSQPFNLTPGLASGGVTVNPPSGQTRNPTIDFGLYLPSADLQVLKSVNPSTYVVGVASPVIYTFVITNFGPDTVINAPVTDTQPANITFNSWTCAIVNGGAGDACGAAAGTGDILTTVSLHAGASAVWTINATVGIAATGPLTNTVREALPAGMVQDVINRQDTASVPVQPNQPLFSLGNRVWFDTNDDGTTAGPGTAVGVPSVLMQLVDASGTVVQTQLTDGTGYYRFDNLPAGTYSTVVAGSNFQIGGPLQGYRNSTGVTTTTDLNGDDRDHGLNTSPNPAVDGIASVSVTLGLGLQPIGETGVGGGTDGPHGDAQSNLTLDFGFNRQQTGNQLWFDTNNNGIFEPSAGELAVPAGVIVNLHLLIAGLDINLITTTTDINGQYQFLADNNADLNLALINSGGLRIYVAIPPGQPALNSYIPSTPRQLSGGVDSFNTGALDATGLITSGTFFPLPGSTANGAVVSDSIGETYQPTIDFGFVLETYSAGNRVWFDTNNNGLFDVGESPIPSVTMKLFDSTGTEISSTLTDASGFYRFDNVLAGDYTVQVAASNFLDSGSLYGYRNSTPTTNASGNLADDNADHGINTPQPGVDGVFSSQFTLGHNLQPVGESTGASGSATNGPGGDPTDNLTLDFGFYKLALGNLIWIDNNNNGLLDTNEDGLDGVIVRLFASDGVTEIPVGPDGVLGTADDGPGGMLTRDGGQYEFSGLEPGDYIAQIQLPRGFGSSTGVNGQLTGPYDPAPDPDNNIDNDDSGNTLIVRNASGQIVVRYASSLPVTLTPGGTGALNNNAVDAAAGSTANPTVDFGLYNDLVLGNLIWDDLNNNGVWDSATEPRINGVQVNLYYDANGDGDVNDAGETTPISTTTTANNGLYLFVFLPPGNYVVELAASNFNPGGPLDNYTSSTGVNGSANGPFEAPPDPDTSAIDNDDNGGISGTLGAGGVIRTPVLNLDVGQEPTGESPDNDLARPDQNENLTIDFGVFRYAGLGDYTWIDLNKNGVRDAGEPPLQSVIVELFDASGTLVADTTTNASGYYSFTNLLPGDYAVKFTPPTGYVFTQPNLGGDDSLDSDADTTTGRTITTTLVADEFDPTWDAGFISLYALGNLVWADVNNNGAVDAGESGLPGVAVQLYQDSNADGMFGAGDQIISTTTTNASGFYSFTNLAPTMGLSSTYLVVIPGANFATGGVLNSYQSSDGTVPTTNTINSLDNGINGTPGFVASRPISLSVNSFATLPTDDGDNVPNGALLTGPFAGITDTLPNAQFTNWTVDFGFYSRAGLGDRVWQDYNHNGEQDAGEPGVPGVTVTLQTPTTTLTTLTDANGIYTFTNLLSGVPYTVSFSAPAGYTFTLPNIGSDVTDSDATTAGQTPSVILLPGQFNPTIDAGLWQPMSLGNYVWIDSNNNGLNDEPASNGVGGVTVNLYADNGDGVLGAGDTPISSTTTASDGSYLFTNLISGTYLVQIPSSNFAAGGPLFNHGSSTGNGAAVTNNNLNNDDDGEPQGSANNIVSRPITLVPGTEPDSAPSPNGNTNLSVDFGFFPYASLGDRVWFDLNANGIQDTSEVSGVVGTQVVLYSAVTNQPVATTTTDANGLYTFTQLIPGDYFVQFDLPAGWTRSPQNANGNANEATDSDASVSTGRTAVTTLVAGENDPTWDAGLYFTASLGDRMWEDLNRNGVQDAGEPGVSGVRVTLFANGQPISTTTTDATGFYQFSNLTPGVPYSTSFGLPAGFQFTTPNANNNGSDAADSDVDAAGRTPTVTLGTNEHNPNLDAGIWRPATIGDRVWLDSNRDGVQGVNEPGVPNVPVTLYQNGVAISQTTTNAQGIYSFTGLIPGTYSLTFGLPTGYSRTQQDALANGTDAADSDANVTTGATVSTTLVSGETDPTWDMGLYLPAGGLGDYVWMDVNGDGQQQPSEPALPGVVVTLYTNGSPISTTTTNSSGAYSFTNLVPGVAYTVQFGLLPGFAWTRPLIGAPTTDSNVNAGGQTMPVTLLPDEFNSTVDAGLVPVVKVGKAGVGSSSNGSIGSDNRITYTLTISNNGTLPMSGLVVSDVLPAGVTFIGNASLAPNGTNPLFWNLSPMQPGEVRTISFVASVANNAMSVQNTVVLLGLVSNTTTPLSFGEATAITPRGPTAVALVAFTAKPVANGVQVAWQTGSEINSFGFALYRAESGDRATAKMVTAQMIAAHGAGDYHFDDTTAQAGVAYRYWLVEAEMNGAISEYGPAVLVPATAAQPVIDAVVAPPVIGPVTNGNATQTWVPSTVAVAGGVPIMSASAAQVEAVQAVVAAQPNSMAAQNTVAVAANAVAPAANVQRPAVPAAAEAMVAQPDTDNVEAAPAGAAPAASSQVVAAQPAPNTASAVASSDAPAANAGTSEGPVAQANVQVSNAAVAAPVQQPAKPAQAQPQVLKISPVVVAAGMAGTVVLLGLLSLVAVGFVISRKRRS